MWGRKNKIVESKFWSGESITIKSISSYFGKFIKILNDLSQDELFEKLQNYKKLLDNGLILQGEYDAFKKEILSFM